MGDGLKKHRWDLPDRNRVAVCLDCKMKRWHRTRDKNSAMYSVDGGITWSQTRLDCVKPALQYNRVKGVAS